ncbi:Styrene-oxide isomerase [Halioglobus japonicus]|nr:Styrene-oxide isomerase [Halioglobus japonicus]
MNTAQGSVSASPNELKRSQRLLLGHGALVLLFGFAMGFGFLFFLIGEISLWPIPGKIDYQMPGTYDAWRMAHMEGITNGLMLWILAAVLPVMSEFVRKIYWLAVTMVVVAWTIVVASAIDPFFPDARGLLFSSQSNLANGVAFFLFYIGIVAVCVVVAIVAFRAFRSSD